MLEYEVEGFKVVPSRCVSHGYYDRSLNTYEGFLDNYKGKWCLIAPNGSPVDSEDTTVAYRFDELNEAIERAILLSVADCYSTCKEVVYNRKKNTKVQVKVGGEKFFIHCDGPDEVIEAIKKLDRGSNP